MITGLVVFSPQDENALINEMTVTFIFYIGEPTNDGASFVVARPITAHRRIRTVMRRRSLILRMSLRMWRWSRKVEAVSRAEPPNHLAPES